MSDLLNPAVLPVLATFAMPVIIVVSILSYKYLTWSKQADLKREMIQRGMSADEIERVLNAGGKP